MDSIKPTSGNEISGQVKEIKARDFAVQEKDRLAAKKVARDFESMFVGIMMKSMRETVGKDNLTGGGHGEEMYRSMLDQEYAKAACEGQGFGLAGTIEKELLKSMAGGDNNKSNLSPDGTMHALKQQSDGIEYQPKNIDYYK
jgi:peptidoglycan hydrolase FlgJ